MSRDILVGMMLLSIGIMLILRDPCGICALIMTLRELSGVIPHPRCLMSIIINMLIVLLIMIEVHLLLIINGLLVLIIVHLLWEMLLRQLVLVANMSGHSMWVKLLMI